MYTEIEILRKFKNYKGSREEAFKEILDDALAKIILKHPQGLQEDGESILEAEIKRRFSWYFSRTAINGVPFFDIYSEQYEGALPGKTGHVDQIIRERDTGIIHRIEYKCFAEFSATGKGRRGAENEDAFAVHKDIERLETYKESSNFFILVTDNRLFYEETEAKATYRKDLQDGKIYQGTHIKSKKSKKTGQRTYENVKIKKDYTFSWLGEGKTKGFILNI